MSVCLYACTCSGLLINTYVHTYVCTVIIHVHVFTPIQDRYGMVSSERPPPPVAKPRKSTSSSGGSKPPTVRRVEERDPMIGHTPMDRIHDDRHPIVDNDDEVDDDVLRLRREREEMMQLLKSSPSTEIGSENGIKDVEDDEEEKFYDAPEEPLPQISSIRREPEGGSANDHQYQRRSPRQSGLLYHIVSMVVLMYILHTDKHTYACNHARTHTHTHTHTHARAYTKCTMNSRLHSSMHTYICTVHR